MNKPRSPSGADRTTGGLGYDARLALNPASILVSQGAMSTVNRMMQDQLREWSRRERPNGRRVSHRHSSD